jgi:hypothetical protein
MEATVANKTWDDIAATLRAKPTLKVSQYALGEAFEEDMLEVIDLMGANEPPEPMLDFFTQANGVTLMWSGTLEGKPARGAVHIVTMLQSCLRVPLEEDGEPLEGVLWAKSYDARALAALKRMAIFEILAGRDEYLTYLADERDARLFLVSRDRIAPLVPDFVTTMELIERYAGADGLREHLTHDDFRARIDADESLQRIARL